MKRLSDGRWIVLLLAALVLTPVLCRSQDYNDWADWPNLWLNQGGGISNRREAPFETKISQESVTKLSLKWTAFAGFDVSANPSIDGRGRGAVYFSSWDGCVYAVTKDTGERIWRVNLTEVAPTIPGLLEGIHVLPFLKSGYPALVGAADLISRSTPTIAGPLLLVGIFGPCYVLALNRSTGAVVWWNSVDTNLWCILEQSGAYYRGAFYIGTSSTEEGVKSTTCCLFQGAMFKINAKTGATVWRVSMLPDNHKQQGLYSGAAIWGSSPAIDSSRRLVYIATGNDYTTPPDIADCEQAQLNKTNRTLPDPCIHPDNHAESFVAINIDTGNITWATHLGGYDTWTYLCYLSPFPSPNCPKILGSDNDFGEAPFFITIKDEHNSSCKWRDVVVAGQKSGVVHALDRETGEIIWQTDAGPGSIAGGSSWGMTTDGERVFTNIINGGSLNFTLVPSSEVITWGGWVALNASTGAIVWSTANPDPLGTQAPVAYANGVVFGASQGNFSSSTPRGKVVALDSATGAVLWTYATEGPAAGGVAIMDGCIFQPVGQTSFDYNPSVTKLTHGHSLIALCIPVLQAAPPN